MDEVARYNVERWKALAKARALWTRPRLDLDAEKARALLDPEGRLGDVAERRVLCLAGGGGRESVAWALLGARVTVFDLSEEQLRRDAEAAAHYGLKVETLQGDIRDLSRFDDAAFDIVWHSYSLNFVPDARGVFRGVARVVRERGLYCFMCANPFTFGLHTEDWDGRGYALKQPYVGGAEWTAKDQPWLYEDGEGANDAIPGSREYRHTLGALVGGLVEKGFLIRHVSDDRDLHPDADEEPGTWDHFVVVAPPWLFFWTEYRPGVL